MSKLVKTLRTHWKKSLFLLSSVSYGSFYLFERKRNASLMQSYCYEALKHGRDHFSPDNNIKRVTVFLNPVANKERGKYVYDKNAAPLLHLSGLDVRLVRLEKTSEACEYVIHQAKH
jgi:acylglycerol kinase